MCEYYIGIDVRKDGEDCVVLERRYSNGMHRLAACVYPTEEDGEIILGNHQLVTALEELSYPLSVKEEDALHELLKLDQMDFQDELIDEQSFIDPDWYSFPLAVL